MKSITDFSPRIAKIDSVPGRKKANFPEITDEVFWNCYELASPFSLVHVTGFFNVYQSLKYISNNKIDGDIVECGCFLGGVGIFIAKMRNILGMTHKHLTLFDSFEGFPSGEVDFAFGRTVRSSRYVNTEADVRENFINTIGVLDNIDFVPGFVEKTLPEFNAGPLCMLRLDTDFYNSTKVELEILYEKLVRGGVLIVDDYGSFQGARKATDEFFFDPGGAFAK